MGRIVTEICKNCRISFYGEVKRGAPPKFCSQLCYREYRFKPRQIKKRFWSYVDVGNPDECWLWTGNTSSTGYGHFSYRRQSGKNKQVKSHRFAYRIVIGRIPKELFVCHSCDVPLCCNPNHLFLGTQRDNMADMISKGRQSKRRGETHHSAKLTDKVVHDILRLYRKGHSQLFIADLHNISQASISDICNGKSWKHVERTGVQH